MKILSIDTASNLCTVAILEDKSCIKETIVNDARNHSEKIMPVIEQTLQEAGLTLHDIDLIVCDKGPGSFTGIRIGVGTVLAFQDSLNIPCIGISALESLAYNVNQDGFICSLIDARNNQVYCGLFDSNHTLIGNYMADDINTILPVINQNKDILFVGDGAVAHKGLLNINNFRSDNLLHAKNINLCAFNKFSKGEILSADSILPMYLRKSQAERMRNLNG